jgi:hypothetical protein
VYFLVPREVTANSAIVWVAAVDEPVQPAVGLEPANLGQQTAAPWQTWPPTGTARVRHREIKITGLTARQNCEFTLRAGAKPVASCRLTTLPAKLPLLGDGKPFTVLLGSCFAQLEDSEGKVGNAFFHMPQSASPDVKVLAGDQVYLDSPAWDYATHRYSEAQLRDRFLRHYVATWGQKDGFARLLGDGANFFCSDDHEYWNNAPNRGALSLNTYLEADRNAWLAAAKGLYRAFQTPRSLLRFDVAPLSFLIADTRISRDPDQNQFLPKADFDEVAQWVKALQGPGVLVIGQPLLWRPTSWLTGTVADWNLPDYKQYHQLVDVVAASPHSLIVLTGDVHFGRVAYGKLRSGGELVEIISSPLSLVDPRVRGSWEEAPPTFPVVRPEDVTGELLARNQMITEAGFQATDSHFLTLEFTQRGPGAQLSLRYWPVFKGGLPPSDFGKTVWQRTFT